MGECSSVGYVYYLRDPITNEIRYVGLTTQPRLRRYNHLRNDGARGLPLSQWIELLSIIGRQPVFEFAMCRYSFGLKSWERLEIYRQVASGARLLNSTYNHSGLPQSELQALVQTAQEDCDRLIAERDAPPPPYRVSFRKKKPRP